jgi:hypothetical protein
MGLGASIVLVAIGAILVWGVTTDAEGINVDAVGWILMIVGLVGFLISLFFWSSWGGPGAFRRRATYVEGDPYAPGYVAPPAAAPPRRVDVVEEDVAGPPPPGAPPPPP